MNSAPQRATFVLEHVSAISNFDEEGYEDSWYVVAYLVLDSGKRKRTTLYRCDTRAKAAAALETIWAKMTAERLRLVDAA